MKCLFPFEDAFGLSSLDYFNYLSMSGGYKVEGTDDVAEFEDTKVCNVICEVCFKGMLALKGDNYAVN